MEYRKPAPRAARGTFPYRDHRTMQQVLDQPRPPIACTCPLHGSAAQ
jgi:hypothetical protein